MSLCINPDCPQPDHPDNGHSLTCQGCGSELTLQGRYRVMRILSSQTGFGTVYEAYERNTPKILKVLRRDRAQNPKVLELFQQEAIVLSRIRGAGVPHVEADGYFTFQPAGSETPLYCLIMEKIDGPNLAQWMQQQGNHPISEQQAIQWLTQLTDILRRIHQQNYFHRDIKPDNIMLRANGQLVLVDFGAAREMSQTYLAQVGNLGGITTVSSAGYTPPEQEHGQAVPQSDFFALGRTIIYLLTAKSPNDSDIYDPQLNAFHWRTHAPHIGADFADLLDHLIAPRVIDRPKTAQEILDRLHRISVQRWMAEGEAATALEQTRSPTEVGALPTTADASRSRSPISQADSPRSRPQLSAWTWLIGGTLTVAGVALVGSGVWWLQSTSQPIAPGASLLTPEPAKQEPSTVPAQPVSLLQTLAAHDGPINDLRLLSDGRHLLSASADKTVRLWNLSQSSPLQTLEHSSFVNDVTLSPDESILYSGGANGTIYLWDLAKGELQRQFAGHTSAINTLDRTPDGQRLVSGSADGRIKVWDTARGEELRTLVGHEGAVNTLVITADGQRIISGSSDRTIRVWDLETGSERLTLKGHNSYINHLVVSPDGQFLFSASADATIKRWELRTGELMDTLTDHDSYVNVLALSRDGQTLYSGSADATVQLWDVKTGYPIATLSGFDMPIDHLAVPSDKQVVTASQENSAIKIWQRDR